MIPEKSILRKAIFDPGNALEFDRLGALLGIYEKRKLAEEHMRIEKRWRIHDKIWILKVEGE